jgi:phenylacetate-CoA ligase
MESQLMDPMSRVRNRAIYALFAVTGSRIPEYLAEFRRLEGADLATVRADEERRLVELLQHASAHVPYYRRLLGDYGVVRDGKVNLDRFPDIPILTKEDILSEGEALHSDDMKGRHPFDNTSGGSTGSPARFIQDREFYDKHVVAAKFIYNEYLGKLAGEPEVNLWGSERDVYRGTLSPRERFTNYVYNRRFLNAFTVTESKLRSFVDEINSHKPVSLWVYVESIDVLSRFIEDQGLEVHSPKFIISTAGALFEPIRERVERVFRCPVFNQYGSREVGAIAIETRDRKYMRGFPYLNHVETIDGDIIVTCLNNYSMPLIRYKIGDTAVPVDTNASPSLGVERPVMKTVSGRVISHFKTPDGGLVHGQYLIHQFYFVDWIQKFQVEQTARDQVVCHVVLKGEPVAVDIERIEKNIKRVMGEDCRVSFDYCEEIPPSPSGKYLYTICRI